MIFFKNITEDDINNMRCRRKLEASVYFGTFKTSEMIVEEI